MNKTEKYLVAFLLANIALAGALHFFPPVKPVPPADETPQPVQVARGDIPISTTSTIGVVKNIAPVEIHSLELALDEQREWAQQDPQAALSWAAQQPVGDDRDEILATACFKIAEDHPADAVALAERFCLTNGGTLDNLVQQWAQKDLSSACKWVQAKEASSQREELVERVGLVWSATEPQKAAQFVVAEIPPGPQQTEAAITILHQWALQDFDGAESWVEQFPEGPIRDRAFNELEGIKNYRQAMAAQASP